MNVNVQENPKNKRRIILIVAIISVCIISVFLAVYIQWFKEKSIEELEKENERKEKNLKAIEILEKDFDSIFLNEVKIEENSDLSFVKKIEENKEIIYTRKNEENENNIVNINIPYINIDSKIIEQYNTEIEDLFVEKYKSILKDNKNEIYTIDYIANINDNILSLLIKCTVKKQDGAQRKIIETFCYDLKKDVEINIKEILEKKEIDKKNFEKEIIEKIKNKQNEVIALKELGYEIFERNVDDEIYKTDNINNFYLNEDGYLYVIFAYGNINKTSEMDLVIF